MPVQNAQLVYLDSVKGLLEENEIEKALDLLRDLDKQTGADIWQDLAMQYSRLRSDAKAQREGIISYDEYRRYQAQVRAAVLDIMKSLPRKVELQSKTRNINTFSFSVPDDARLEKIIGEKNNLLRISWLERALKASKAVCRVVCADGNKGTGFLTKDGYLFTNNHVLQSAAVAKTARIEFNYELDSSGSVKARTVYELDANDFKTSTPDQLDFACVKVIDRADAPLSQWGHVEFDAEAIPTAGDAVTIIQHPKGEDKQIALNANEVLGQLNQHLFYTTDTEPGSSGSPVFNKDWRVVAIHHAGKTDAEGGLIVNAKGDRKGANRGILFRDIFAFLGGQPTSTPASGTASHESLASAPIASNTNSPQTSAPPAHAVAASQPAVSAVPKFVVIYDLADDSHCKLLNKYLNILKITKKIRVYNVHEALAGEDVMSRANAEMADADYLVALVTVNLLNSPDWFGLVYDALQNGRRVIPIRVEIADYEGTGLEKLRPLPTGKAVSEFPNADAAYNSIVTEMKKLLPASK